MDRSIWRTGLCCLTLAAAAPGQDWKDPMADLAEALDAPGREILEGFPSYEADRIWKAIETLEARQGTPAAREPDRYVLALGYLELLVIERYHERRDPDSTPALFAGLDLDEVSDRGQAHAVAYAADHPTDSDIHRIRGELISFQIHGMTSGMSKGPEAREAVERALELDPGNAWALFARGRMHFHNPAIAGGDKDLALEELRGVSRAVSDFRVSIYLSMTYYAKGMLPQARFWALKTLRQAPSNPEARSLLADIDAEIEESGR